MGRESPAGFACVASRGRWGFHGIRHLELLNEKFLAVARGEIRRLAINMPPRHGKSEFASKYLPGWYLGMFPRRRVILASYGASFASQWGRKVRDLLDEDGDWIFDVRIRGDSKAADIWEIADHAGGMQTCGVGGPLTGKGADLLIIDDPIKNAEEANSETYREKTWDWFTSTAYTRLEPGGALIVIQTRWHEDDLTGRILRNAAETGERWDTVNLPALAGDGDILGRRAGEALWPERYGEEELGRIRRTIGSYQFSALYDQSPSPADGGLFKRHWFRYWKRAGDAYQLIGPDGARHVRSADCRRFGTMDLAFSLKKSADFTVIAAWAVTPAKDLILLDLLRERMEAKDLVPSVKAMTERWGLAYVGIEKILGQALVVSEARQSDLNVRQLLPDADKVTRSIPAQIRMEGGQIYLPEGHPLLDDVEKELLSFPRGAHDDIVDVIAYAATEVVRFGGSSESDETRKEQRDAAESARLERLDRLRRSDPWGRDRPE